MNITVKVVKENKDGSADAMVNFDAEGLEFLIQEGLLSVLGQYIKQNKNAREGQKLRKKINKSGEEYMDVSHHKEGKVTTTRVKK
jgi:hypothetical protein